MGLTNNLHLIYTFGRPDRNSIKNKEIELNVGKEVKKIIVTNTGNRPIQVGSHFHFFEVNKFLKFDRKEAYGFRLDIASGTSVRFEAGETKEVELITLGGNSRVLGLNSLTNGQVNDSTIEKSLMNAEIKGFK